MALKKTDTIMAKSRSKNVKRQKRITREKRAYKRLCRKTDLLSMQIKQTRIYLFQLFIALLISFLICFFKEPIKSFFN